MRTIVLLILTCFNTRNDAALSTPDRMSPLEKNFINCILEISRRDFYVDRAVGILSYSTIPDSEGELKHNATFRFFTEELLFQMNSSGNWTVLLTNNYSRHFEIPKDSSTTPYAVIMILDDDLQSNVVQAYFLMIITMLTVWPNPQAYVLLVDMRTPSNLCRDRPFEKFFTALWKILRIVNAVILSLACDSNYVGIFDIALHSWLPLTNADLSNEQITNFTTIKLESNEDGTLLKDNVFSPKEVNNFRDSKIVICPSLHVPYWIKNPNSNVSINNIDSLVGPMANLFKIIARSLNFKLVVSFDAKLPLKFYGPERNFTLNVLKIIVPPIISGGYTFFVPNYVRIPQWQSILKVFPPILWIFVLITYMITSLTFWLIESTNFKNKTKMFQNVENKLVACFLETMRPLIGSSVSLNFRQSVSLLLFAIWLYYSLQINTAYQSCLVDFLTNPRFVRPIRNFKELEESDYRLCLGAPSTPNDLDYFSNLVIAAGIKKKLTRNNYTLAPQNNAFICIRDSMEFRKYTKLKDGRPYAVVLEENFYCFIWTFAFRAGTFVQKHYSKIYYYLENAGIISKWTNDFRRYVNGGKFGEAFDKQFVVLSLEHLQGALYLLTVGLLISFFCFICENIVFSIYKNRRM